MKLYFFVVAGLLLSNLALSQTLYLEYYKSARKNYERENYQGYLRDLKKADSLRPNHQILMYNLAGAYALNGNAEEAFRYLHKAIVIKADLPFEKDTDFVSIRDQREFSNLLKEKEKLLSPVANSVTAFEIPVYDTHIESIAFNPSDGSYYLGSINKRKIIRQDAQGNLNTFKKQGEDGLMAVFGMAIDDTKQILWVTTSALPEMEGYKEKDQGKAAVYAFNLSDRKLLKRYEAPMGEHLFGDLIITDLGVLVSDSFSNQIFVIRDDRMEVLVESNQFLNLQGIAFSKDQGSLFVADYVRGLFKADINSKEIVPLGTATNDYSLKGIDGLIFYNNSLIAIQNGTIPNKVVRYFLDERGDAITEYEILESNNSKFGEPSLGVLVNNWLYYVGNSQWPLYNEEHQFVNDDQIPITIFKVEFK